MKHVYVHQLNTIYDSSDNICDVEIDGHEIRFHHKTFKTCDDNEYTVDLYTLGAYPIYWFSGISHSIFRNLNRELTFGSRFDLR